MKFSIIVASFRAGEKLNITVESILAQTFRDYEIIVKDGGSKDGSLEVLREADCAGQAISENRLKLIVKPDGGVYDGMNQALEVCQGEYILFLNCGDIFHDRQVLARVSEKIAEEEKTALPAIFYGNTFCKRTGAMVHSAPEITGFTCYRNIPCHQSCFYARELFQDKKYDTALKIRADYEHFLWCYYEKRAVFCYLDMVIADYEGGGISEAKENRKTDKTEQELVIRKYMFGKEILKYKTIMLLTLAPLRRRIAENSRLSGLYHRIKSLLYG